MAVSKFVMVGPKPDTWPHTEGSHWRVFNFVVLDFQVEVKKVKTHVNGPLLLTHPN